MNIQETLKKLDLLFKEKRINEVEQYLTAQLQFYKKIDDWESQLTLLNELIGFCRSIDNHRKAIEYGNQVLDLLNEKNLKGTIPYGTTLLNIATVHRAYGNFDEALKLFSEVTTIYENEIAAPDYRLSGLYNNISVTYEEMNNYEVARDYARKSLKIINQIPGEEIRAAIVMNNLATIEFRLGNRREAVNYLEESLSIFKKQKAKDSHYGAGLSTLAYNYYIMGDLDKAAEIYSEALTEIKNNYGENYAYAITCKNCALVYEKLGNFQEVEKYKTLSLKAEKRLLTQRPKCSGSNIR